jgi:nitrite reductase/ring-hydroxylating ferredoxin subunit/uncharacterized membrane protein
MSTPDDAPRPRAPEARRPRTYAAVDGLGRLEAIDPPATALSGWVRSAIPKGPVKDALSGTWLGHAAHPPVTDLPIGFFSSALALDWLGGRDAGPAADRLLALGLASTLPAVATGASEWADSAAADDTVRRVGLVHAASNSTATLLFTGSLVARRRGARGLGKLLALAAGGAMAAGGLLGGHLTLASGVGVDQTTFETPDEDWHDVLAEAELGDGKPHCVDVGGIPVLVARDRGELVAISDTCTHRGGALHEGEIEDGCVTCPLHGSVFRLRDGSVMSGPSAYPQPIWEARVSGGRVEVRPAA